MTGLEALNNLRKDKRLFIYTIPYIDEQLNVIKKELKALEIIIKYIKLKKIGGFPVMELDNGGIYTMLKTMKEYDLLKEVLQK